MGRSFRILEKSLEEFQIFPIFQKILERSWKESKNPTNPPKNLKESWKDAEEIERILKLRNLKGSSKESQGIPKLFFNNPNESFKESSNYPEDPKRNLKESFKDPRNIEIIFEIIPKLFDNLKESFKKKSSKHPEDPEKNLKIPRSLRRIPDSFKDLCQVSTHLNGDNRVYVMGPQLSSSTTSLTSKWRGGGG